LKEPIKQPNNMNGGSETTETYDVMNAINRDAALAPKIFPNNRMDAR